MPSFYKIALKAYPNSSEGCSYSTRKVLIVGFLLSLLRNMETWIFFAQDCFSGCPCFTIWLNSLPCTIPRYMWNQLFCWPCPFTFEGRISFSTALWSKGSYSWTIIRSLSHCGDWASSAASCWWNTRLLINVQDGTYLDITVNDLWGGYHERWYMYIRVFNPMASSNSGITLILWLRKHPRSGAQLFHFFSVFCYWGNGTWSQYFFTSD